MFNIWNSSWLAIQLNSGSTMSDYVFPCQKFFSFLIQPPVCTKHSLKKKKKQSPYIKNKPPQNILVQISTMARLTYKVYSLYI